MKRRFKHRKRTLSTQSILIQLALIVASLVINTSSYAEVYVEKYANLNASDGLVLDSSGNLYAASYAGGQVYKISPEHEVTLLMDTQNGGPAGMVFDDLGNLYIALYNTNTIRRIDADGQVYDWITGLNGPIGLDLDSEGNLYVANFGGNPTISKISPSGTVSSFVQINAVSRASSIAIDDADNAYLVNYLDSQIYKITPDGSETLLSNSGPVNNNNNGGFGFIMFNNDQFYLTKNEPYLIETMDLQGNRSTFAGTGDSGSQDGLATQAEFHKPNGLTVSSDGEIIMVAEGERSSIRKLFFADADAQLPAYFTSAASSQATQDKNYSYQMLAQDHNQDTVSFSTEDLPSWLSFDGVDTVSGTPTTTDAVGDYSLVVTVSDSFQNEVSKQKTTIVLSAAVVPVSFPDEPKESGGGSLNWLFCLLIFSFIIQRKLLGRKADE